MNCAYITGRNKTVSIPARVLLMLVTTLYIGYFTYQSLEYWWGGMHCSLDYARIDSAAHNTSIGKFMWSNDAHFNYWSQHIAPILFFFSALYFFTDAYWPTFFVQSFTIGAAAIPLFLIAGRILKNEWLALLAVLVYLSNGNMQMANLFDYHMLSHEPLFLFSAIYTALRKRWGFYFTFVTLLIICKEDAFILASMIGLYVALVEKEYKKAFYTWVYCGVYALIVFKIGYPMFRDSLDAYQYSGYYSWMGATPLEIIKNILTDPVGLFYHNLFSNEIRYGAWLNMLTRYGFTPLLSPIGFAMAFPPSMELFLANRGDLFLLTHHYPLLIVPIWTFATVLGMANVQRIAGYFEKFLSHLLLPQILVKTIRYAIIAIMVVYGLSTIVYAIHGPYDFTVLFLKIRSHNFFELALIFFAGIFFFIVFFPPRSVTRIFGNAGGRIAGMTLVYIVTVNLFYGAEFGALPYYSYWAKLTNGIDKNHTDKVKTAVKLIPHGAVVITNPGAFAHLHHHTTAYISLEGYRPPFEKTNVEFFLLDANDAQNLGRHQQFLIEKLIWSREYGVIHADDRIFVFQRGASKKNDIKYYSDNFWTYTARTFVGYHPEYGEVVKDKSATNGEARLASRDKAHNYHLVYGPYLKLASGRYEVMFRVKIKNADDSSIGTLDIATDEGRNIINEINLTAKDFNAENEWHEFKLPFLLEKTQDRIEFRVHYDGGADLYLDMIKLKADQQDFLSSLRETPDFK